MRRARAALAIALALVAALGITSCAGSGGRKLQGTWELASPPMDPRFRELKHITPTHFTWVTYDRATHEPVACGGGPCVVKGDTYQERIEFALGPVASLVGTLQTFHVTVEGDTLLQTGTLTNGREIREVWARARTEAPPEKALDPYGKPSPKRSDPLSGRSR